MPLMYLLASEGYLATETLGYIFRANCTHFPFIQWGHRFHFDNGTFAAHPTSELSSLSTARLLVVWFNARFSHEVVPGAYTVDTWSFYLIMWSVWPVCDLITVKSPLDVLHLFAGVCFWRSAYLSFYFVSKFTLPFKYKVQMRGKTEMSCGFSLPTILKDAAQQSKFRGNIRYTEPRDDLWELKIVVKRWIKLQQQVVFNYCLKNNDGHHL